MDELLKSLRLAESVTPVVTVWAILFGTVLAALLAMGIGLVYRRIHAEAAYSQSLVHTFVLLAMITTLIMAIIGSNIARAFSLVGALSIIRFRTAIKSPLDVGFLFLAIAVGMACGIGFYGVATVATVLVSSIMFLLYRFNFASYPARREYLLAVCFHLDVDYEQALDPLLGELFSAYSLSFAETVRQGTQREVVYSVSPKPEVTDKQVLDAVAAINDNLKISYRTIRHAIEVP